MQKTHKGSLRMVRVDIGFSAFLSVIGSTTKFPQLANGEVFFCLFLAKFRYFIHSLPIDKLFTV